MRGRLRIQGRPALITLRLAADDIPSEAEVTVADVMLQPGGSASGWLPHVTEMPWSAGVTPDGEAADVYSRLNALESEVDVIRTDIQPITVPGDVWRGESVSWDPRISSEWHPDHGWISWVDLEGLADDGATGDIALYFDRLESGSSSDHPARWGVVLLSDQAEGVSSLTARLDVIDDADEKVGEKGSADLDVWPTWTYDVRHDVIVQADTSLEPRVILRDLGSEASGRIGLATPWLGTAFERSE